MQPASLITKFMVKDKPIGSSSDNDSDSSSTHKIDKTVSKRQSVDSQAKPKKVTLKIKRTVRAQTADKLFEIGVRESRTNWINPVNRTYVSLNKSEQDYHRDIG